MSHNEPLNRSKLLKLAFAIMQNDLDETMDQKDLIKLAFLKLADRKKDLRKAKQKANMRRIANSRAQSSGSVAARTGVATIIPNSYNGPKVGGLPEIKALFGLGEDTAAKSVRKPKPRTLRTNGPSNDVAKQLLKQHMGSTTAKLTDAVKASIPPQSNALTVIPASNVVSTASPKSAPKGPGFWERFGKRVSESGQKGWNATKQFGKGIGAKGFAAGKFLGRNKGKAALVAAVLAALHEHRGKNTARRELGASNAKIDRLMNRGFFDRLFNRDV